MILFYQERGSTKAMRTFSNPHASRAWAALPLPPVSDFAAASGGPCCGALLGEAAPSGTELPVS